MGVGDMSLPNSTKRLVKDRPGPSFEHREVALSPPQGDELLVRVSKVALCGTDISLYLWNNGELFFCACKASAMQDYCFGGAAYVAA